MMMCFGDAGGEVKMKMEGIYCVVYFFRWNAVQEGTHQHVE
jgi:hypothetical protein